MALKIITSPIYAHVYQTRQQTFINKKAVKSPAGRRRQSVLKSPITQPLYKRQYIYTAPVGVDNCAFLKWKKVKLSSYPSQLSSIQVLYHTVPAGASQGVEDSYLNPPVNTFIALRCMEARRPVDIVLIQIYFYERYTKWAIMAMFEVGTGWHWCDSSSVILPPGCFRILNSEAKQVEWNSLYACFC